MTRAPVRVLVLAASGQRRQRLQRLLHGDAALQVVDAVANASQAIAAVERCQAAVILIGQGSDAAEAIAATRSIMQARATPIVVLAAATSPVQEQVAFALMEAGALTVLRDPGPATDAHHAQALQALLDAVRLMAEVKVVRRWPPSTAAPRRPPPERKTGPAPAPTFPAEAAPATAPASAGGDAGVELVAIGASTGGPVALKELLCVLPASFPAPIVIVQHMADGFLQGLADWLSASCSIRTEVAGPFTELAAGHAYLAPDGSHMRVGRQGKLVFDRGPPVNGHRPAVACLLASVAQHCGARAIGILLTGMGKDGAAELKVMREHGAVTFAQDEASAVVHGMPGEAIRIGAACHVMSPREIGLALPTLAAARREGPTP